MLLRPAGFLLLKVKHTAKKCLNFTLNNYTTHVPHNVFSGTLNLASNHLQSNTRVSRPRNSFQTTP